MGTTTANQPTTIQFAEWTDQEMEALIGATYEEQQAMIAAKYNKPAPKPTNVHSFKYTESKRHNITISFIEGNKERKICFKYGTDANLYCHMIAKDYDTTNENEVRRLLEYIRQTYSFKKNPNNPSIFRPILKAKN